MSGEVGSGQIAIYPVFKGFRKAVSEEVDGEGRRAGGRFSKGFDAAGRNGGRSAGRGFRTAFATGSAGVGAAASKQLTANVAKAAKALSAARLKEQDSAGKVRVAEAALVEARKRGVAGSARVVAAEERLSSVSRGLTSAQDSTRASTLNLRTAQASLAASTERTTARTRTSLRSLLTNTFSRGAAIGGSAGRDLGRGFTNSFKSALAPLAGLAAGYIGFTAIRVGLRKLFASVKVGIDSLARIETINAQTKSAIKATGGAARVTAKHIEKLTGKLEAQTATEAESIQQGANLLLTFKNIRNEAGKGNKIFDMSVTALTDMARAMGKDPATAAVQLGKALNDPIKGISALSKVGVTFSADQKKVIESLVKTGDVAGAQKVILKELNSEFGGSGKAYAKTFAGTVALIGHEAGTTQETLSSGLMPTLKRFAKITLGVLQDINESPLLGLVTKKINDISAVVGTNVEDIIDMVKKLAGSDDGITFDGVRAGLQKLFPFLKPLNEIITALQPVLPALVSAIGELAPVLAPLLPSLTKVVIELLPVFVDLILALLPIIPSLAESIADMAPALSELVSFFSLGVQDVIDFSTAAGALFGLLYGDTSFEEFFGKVIGLKGDLGSIFRDSVTIGENIGQDVGKFLGGIIADFELFKERVSRALSGVGDQFKHLPETIRIALSRTPAQTFAVGQKIVKGLISGIAGMAPAALREVTTLGTNIVAALSGVLDPLKALDAEERTGGASAKKNAAAERAKALKAYAKARAAIDKASSSKPDGSSTSGNPESLGALGNVDDIKSSSKSAVAALKSVTSAARLSKFLVGGYVAGITGDLGKVREVISKLSKMVLTARGDLSKAERKALAADVRAQGKLTKSTFSSGLFAGADALLASLKSNGQLKKNAAVERATLADIAKAREVVAARMKAATSKLAAAIGIRDDYRASVRSAVIAFGSITEAAETTAVTITKRIGDVLYTTTQNVAAGAKSMVDKLRESVTKTKAFQATLEKLRKLGVDDTSYEQIVDEFKSTGSTVAADALLAGGKAVVSEVAALQGELAKAGDSLGAATSKALYQGGIDSLQELVKGLSSNDKLLVKAAEALGAKIAAAVRSSLGLKNLTKDLDKSSSTKKVQSLGKMATGIAGSGVVSASTAKSASVDSGDRAITADGIGLIGWIRELANGEAKLVFNTEILSGAARL